MNVKLTTKQFNKLVAYVDRVFTWDNKGPVDDDRKRNMIFFNHDRSITVYISATSNTYVAIRRDDEYIYKGFVKTFHDISMFKCMVKCLG